MRRTAAGPLPVGWAAQLPSANRIALNNNRALRGRIPDAWNFTGAFNGTKQVYDGYGSGL